MMSPQHNQSQKDQAAQQAQHQKAVAELQASIKQYEDTIKESPHVVEAIVNMVSVIHGLDGFIPPQQITDHTLTFREGARSVVSELRRILATKEKSPIVGI